ncbi:peptidylprolyl isomerase [Parachitinimonas caeni]|uniref:Periplasmic chaperone PpiD n=1 Tax=Parachitinimonas caeni TaxID=3031301 RepID=A0ABT7DTJ6_9NEIS|nr:peptidylprolyl isomerase [Parachitinimonas caeni]MDK2123407.1 peptidylprolyl isomerase [Parachitinimonas caeni]
MFDLVHNNRTLVQVALGAVGLGLVVTGGFTFSDYGSEPYVAKVADRRITARDIAEETRGQPVPDAMKPMIVDRLIQKSLLLAEADKRYLVVPDDRLRDVIGAIPQFKKGDKFDHDTYVSMLSAQQMTPQLFEAKVKEDIRLQSLTTPFQASIVSKVMADRLAAALVEQREVSAVELKAVQFLDKVAVSEADAKKYYDANQPEFKVPDRVKLEYLVLSQDEIAAKISVDEAKVREYFDKNQSVFNKEESRKVRHILIQASASASQKDKAAAKAKAEEILAELKKDPSKFGELARKHSQDPTSAEKGGELDYIRRAGQVKAFADVAFGLTKNQLSSVVETEFGYHIIQVLDIKSKTYDEVKPEVEKQLKRQLAQQKMQGLIDQFGEVVYQQADSLKPAAEKIGLSIQRSDWVSKEQASEPVLNNEKLRQAVFGDDVLLKKHNTEAIDVGNGVFVSARIAEYQKASVRPFAEVLPTISIKLKTLKANEMAASEGKKALAALQAGQPATALNWTATKQVSRRDPAGLPEKTVTELFKLPTAKLPTYAGFDLPGGGYAVYKVAKGAEAKLDDATKQGLLQALQQSQSGAEMQAYLATLQKRYKVERAQIKAAQQ